jgi:hypothetical protein
MSIPFYIGAACWCRNRYFVARVPPENSGAVAETQSHK